MFVDDGKARLLIVEDDQFVRHVYVGLLEDINKLEISVVENAEEAMDFISREEPDIVIMDYRLPGMNGLEATKQIVMAHPETIILVITGDDTHELEEEMLEVGAVSFLNKPVRGKLLFFTVQNFVEIVVNRKKLRSLSSNSAVHASADKAHYNVAEHDSQSVNDSGDLFVDSFQNDGLSDEAEKAFDGDDESISSVQFLSQFEDYEDVEDFVDVADNIVAHGETLLTVVDVHLMESIRKLLHDNISRLNMLHEFPTIVYTLEAVRDFMDSSDINSMSDIPMKKLAVFLSDLFEIYSVWLKSVFIDKSAEDIHFKDVELMSFGLQMESIFSDVHVLAESDESATDEGGSVEFF